jgi:hypothetical protein
MSNRWDFSVLTEAGSVDRVAVMRTFAAAGRQGFRNLVAEYGSVAGSGEVGEDIAFADLDEAASYLAAHDGLVVLWSGEREDCDVWISFHHADPTGGTVPSSGGRSGICRFDEISFSVPWSVLNTDPGRDFLYGILRDLFEIVADAENAPYGYVLDEYAAEDLLPAPSGGGLVPCADLPLVLGWLTWFGSPYAGAIHAALADAVGAVVRRTGQGMVLDLGRPREVTGGEVRAKNELWRRLLANLK